MWPCSLAFMMMRSMWTRLLVPLRNLPIAKECQCMTTQMLWHIREVNSMFADERKNVRERYKEYDGCYLGHYARWFFWFFFTIGIFVVAGSVGMMIA